MAGLFFSPSNGTVPPEVTELVQTTPITTIAALKALSISSRPEGNYAENVITNLLIGFSAFSTSGSNLPQNVSDKSTATFYASTGTSTSEFLLIDLGEPYDLFRLEITATSGLADRISNLQAIASLNANLSGGFTVGSIGANNTNATVSFNGNQTSIRYIRIAKTSGTNIIQIAELKVWARETGSYPAGATLSIPSAIANPIKPKIVRVLGRSLINDGGGGEFYLDSADIESLEDGGITFIAANGDRWKRVIEGDFVNVRWFGADHCTSASDPDQGAAITATLRAAAYYSYGKQLGNGTISWNKAMRVIIPPGIYNIRKAIRMPKSLFGTRTTGTHRLIIEGNGRVELQWRGNSIGATDYADRCVILFENYFYSSMRDILITAWGALEYGVLMLNNGGNPTATGISLRNLVIQGINGTPIFGGKILKYGIGFPALGTGGDANNDLPTVTECTVDNAHIAFFGYGLNYHDAVFDRCKINNCNWGVNFGNVGYLRWTNGSSGDTKYADFYFRANSYPTYIIGHNAEHAGRLIDAKSCVAPIYLQGVRYNSQRSHQSYGVVVGSDTTLKIESSLFGFGLSRCCVTGYPYYADTTREFQNTVTIDGCNWLQPNPKILGAEYFENVFGSPNITVPTTDIDTVENTIDFGTGNGVTDGLFFVHNGTVGNHGLNPLAGFFVRVVTGTTKVKLYDSYADYLSNTPITGLKNLTAITFKLAVPSMAYDESEPDGCKFLTLLTDGIQAFPPSRIKNILFDSSKQPDHQLLTQTSKSFSFDNLAVNGLYEVAKINTGVQPGSFLVTVSWGAETAVYLLTPKSNFLGSWRKVSALYTLSETNLPDLYYQSVSVLLSASEVRGLKTLIVMRSKEISGYKVSILPLGGSSNYFLQIEPTLSGYSGTPTTITNAAILAEIAKAVNPTYEKSPLLVTQEGDADSVIAHTPETIIANGSRIINLSKTNNFIIKPSGGLAISVNNIRSGVTYSFDIVWGATPFTVTLASLFKLPAGTPAISNTANTKDTLLCKSSNGLTLDCQLLKNVTPLAPADVPGLLTYVNANDESSLDLVESGSGLVGTVTVTSGSTTVTGTGTAFASAMIPGESIIINSEERVVMAIASETSLTIDLALSAPVSGVSASRKIYTVQRLLDASGLPGAVDSDLQTTAGQRLQLLKKIRGGKNVLAFCPRGFESHNMIWNFSGRTFPARSVLYNCLYKGLRDGKRMFTSPANDTSLTFRGTGAVRVTSGATVGTDNTGFYSANEGTVSGYSINTQGGVKLFKNGNVINTQTTTPPTLETTFHLAATNVTGLPIYFSEIYISNVEWTDTQIFAISELSNGRAVSY